jgi:hypothetical protein
VKRRSAAERFWEKVENAGNDGCWLWTGGVNSKGYGVFNLGVEHNYKRVMAHVYTYGRVPDGMVLDHRHTCPKNCVRPTHLRPVTHAQNQQNRAGATKQNATGVRGVYHHKGRFRAYVNRRHLGIYDTLDEAAEVARQERLRVYTHSDMDAQP